MQKTIIHPAIGEVTLSRTRLARRIALSVRPNGAVRLSFPMWVTQRQAMAFLDEKRDWIEAGRAKMAEKYPPALPLSEEEKAAEQRRVEELRREAKRLLPEMVERLAVRHGFRYGAVRVKASRSKWGSCTVHNDLNLSLFLMQLPEHLIEYVVLHELCHTVHHNHSERFHALLDRVTEGRHRSLNRELRGYRPWV